MMSFWGIQIKANSTKKAELPEDCALMLTNIAMENGKRSEFYVSVDEEPRTLMAVLDSSFPQHTLSLHVPAGATIKFTNVGDALLSLVGCQRFVDDEEDEFDDDDDDEEFDDEDEDDEEIPSDEADEFDDEDEDEEEEKPKKGVKRPEPKQQPKQQPKEKKAEKKAEEKKTEKKAEKKGEGFSAARCEICKRNFNTQEALEQHNAAKHGKK